MSRPVIESKKVFNTDIDLKASRQRVAAFAERSKGIEKGISSLREGILQHREAGKFNNPEDLADFYIAEILQLNMRDKPLGGEEVVKNRLIDTADFSNNLEKEMTEPLFEAILVESQQEKNERDDDLLTILGVCNSYGIGTEKNYAEAFNFFQDAADLGSDEAQFYLSRCYGQGHGVAKDEVEAFKWDKFAAADGNSKAQFGVAAAYLLGHGVEKNDVEAFRFCKLAADQGLFDAKIHCARFYQKGIGVEKSDIEADKIFNNIASDGSAEEHNLLGLRFYEGKEVNQHDGRAVRFFEMAADKGNMHAQNNLAACYEAGRGIGRNHEEAMRLYGITADKGSREGQYQMGYEYRRGDQHVEAAQFFRLAADQNHLLAQYFLGLCYQQGKGVERDEVEAVKFLRRAYDHNHSNQRAKHFLEEEIGSVKQQNLVSAAIAGNTQAVKNSLEKGANVVTETWKGKNALTYAAEQGYVETTNAIIMTVAVLQRNSDAWWFSSYSTKNNGADWQAIRGQLESPHVQNLLTRATIIELAGVFIDQQKELIDEMIANFNDRYPDAPIAEKDFSRIEKLQELKIKQREIMASSEDSPEVVESLSIKAVASLLHDQATEKYYADLAQKIVRMSNDPVLTQSMITLKPSEEMPFNDQELEMLANPDSLEYAFCVFKVKESLEASLGVTYENPPSLKQSAITPVAEKLVRDMPRNSPLKARGESIVIQLSEQEMSL